MAERTPWPSARTTRGTYDSHGTNVFPNSLYYAQLQDRLAAPTLQTREYWLGEIDGFTNGSPAATSWRWMPRGATPCRPWPPAQPLDAFNVVTNNHWVPFTFNFSLGRHRPGGCGLAGARAARDQLRRERRDLSGQHQQQFPFSSLGWLPIGTGTNTTVRVLDLGSQLNLLTDGQLNVAVQGDAGIDWAMLELQVTPVVATHTNIVYPVADTYARGGVNAGTNYGTNTTIQIKTDNSADNLRRGYLRWNLAGYRQTWCMRAFALPL